MPDRADQIKAFLSEAGWHDATRTPLAGDLSPRRYARLRRGDEAAILMDADTTMQPFVEIADWLLASGFSAPERVHTDAPAGLLLLEDFGDTSLTQLLAKAPDQTEAIHDLCVDLLLALRKAPRLRRPCPTASELVAWTEIVDTNYPDVDTLRLAGFRAVLTDLLDRALTEPPSMSLRDFHADNMMWLPDREGTRRFGLLDFQDAFLTHPAYDLVSFLTDARTDVPRERRLATLGLYLEKSGDSEDPFRCAFAALSAQRNLRILGIFAKSAATGKKHHLDKLARVHGYFAEALEHPAFDAVRNETLAALPDPLQAARHLA